MEYVDITGNETVMKGVEHMSGLGMTIMQEAWQEGMEKGIRQGMQEGMQQGMQQGIQQGIQQGENLLARLINCLRKDKRMGDLDLIDDDDARKRLYREYHLIDD